MNFHRKNGRDWAPACGACCTRLENFGVPLGGKLVVEDVNLHLHCGQLTVLIGPNGAGKTSLLRGILGDLPHTGALHFMDFAHRRPDAPLIGYVPQKLDFDRASPVSVLDLFSAALGPRPVFLRSSKTVREAAHRSLDAVDALSLAQRTLGELSGGELQRVLLALSLAPVPDILLLDEPVTGLDASGIERFYRTVSSLREKFDLAILMVSHDVAAAARFADRLVFLNRTVICAGPSADVLRDNRVRRALGLDLPSQDGPAPNAP